MDGSLSTLPNLPGQTSCYGYGINSLGDACGETYGPMGGRACAWIGGHVYDIGFVTGYNEESIARGISSTGQVVGYSQKPGGHSAAFSWQGGTLTRLPSAPNGRDYDFGYGISSAGLIVGSCGPDLTNGVHASKWQALQFSDLGDLAGGRELSIAESVNNFGEIVGAGNDGQVSSFRPARFSAGQVVPLDVYPAGNNFGIANCISDAGIAVGYADNPQNNNTTEGALWTRDGKIHNLMDLAGMPRYNGTTGWGDTQPYGINNKGQVVGFGTYSYAAGKARQSGFRLDPVTTVTPPSSFTVVYGQKTAGNVQSLAAEDGDALRVVRFIVPNQQTDPVQVRVEGTLPFDPMNLWFKLKAKSTVAGAFSVSLNLYDWTTGLFDPASNVTVPLTTSYVLTEDIAKGEISRYVRISDRKVWTLVRARPTGPTAVFTWGADLDLGVWEAVPLP